MKQLNERELNQNWLWKAIPDVTPLEKIKLNANVKSKLKPKVDELIQNSGCKPSEAIIKIIKEEINIMRKNETTKL